MKLLKAQYLFLLSAASLFLIGLLSNVKTFDINLHDTYFVIAGRHFLYSLSMFSLLLALVYFVFSKLERPLNFTIGLVHFVITNLFVFALWQTADLSYSHNSSDSLVRSGIMFSVSTALFIIAQLLFVGNMVWALLKPKVSKP
jgi:heme/copper-type cytochrome/quinol oxidase subunit 1